MHWSRTAHVTFRCEEKVTVRAFARRAARRPCDDQEPAEIQLRDPVSPGNPGSRNQKARNAKPVGDEDGRNDEEEDRTPPQRSPAERNRCLRQGQFMAAANCY